MSPVVKLQVVVQLSGAVALFRLMMGVTLALRVVSSNS